MAVDGASRRRARRTTARAWLLVPLIAGRGRAARSSSSSSSTTRTVDGDSMKPTLLDRGPPAAHQGLRRARSAATSSSSRCDEARQGRSRSSSASSAVPGDTVDDARATWRWVNGEPEPRRLRRRSSAARDRVVGPVRRPGGHGVRARRQPRRLARQPLHRPRRRSTSIHGRVVAIFAPVTRVRLLDALSDRPLGALDVGLTHGCSDAARRTSRGAPDVREPLRPSPGGHHASSPAAASSPRPTSTPRCARCAWRCSRPT